MLRKVARPFSCWAIRVPVGLLRNAVKALLVTMLLVGVCLFIVALFVNCTRVIGLKLVTILLLSFLFAPLLLKMPFSYDSPETSYFI